MRHDYNFPPTWESLTPEEKNVWYTLERNRRQALRQDTPLARRAKEVQRRRQRRGEARAESVSLDDWR